jgi:RHS repeat-associated protein
VRYPSVFAVSTVDTVQMTYDAVGQLATVVDLNSTEFTFGYDGRGREIQREVRAPGSGTVTVREQRSWDDDGRLATRVVTSPTVSPYTIRTDTLTRYDARGKAHYVRSDGEASGPEEQRFTYQGNGSILSSYYLRNSPYAERLQIWRADALGNFYMDSSGTQPDHPWKKRWTYNLAGQLIRKAAYNPGPGVTAAFPDSIGQTFDASGNLDKRQVVRMQNQAFVLDRFENQKHWYAADEKLRYVQRAVVLGYDGTFSGMNTAERAGSWEEYWYDALGRRILLRSRRDSLTNTANKRSHLDRFVWDGNFLIGEIRVPGQDNTNQLDATGGGGVTNDSTGTIAHVYGGAIDQPLSMSDGRILIRDWKGQVESSVWNSGNPADCTRLGSSCTKLNLSVDRWATAYSTWSAPKPSDYAWRGSLIPEQEDGSGQQYKRNRYYDPTTGRFTQVDPIGIAGGLNVYGFGGGDPVTYSDPFGLCVEPASCVVALAKGTTAIAGTAGLAAGAVTLAGGKVILQAGAAASYAVYQSLSEGMNYIGITNNVSRRAGEHLRERQMRIGVLMDGLTKEQARGVEQILIEARGLKRDGGDLMNQINSIAKSNPSYERLTAIGRELLGIKKP